MYEVLNFCCNRNTTKIQGTNKINTLVVGVYYSRLFCRIGGVVSAVDPQAFVRRCCL